MNSTETVWSSALSHIARAVSPEQFQTWFKDVSLTSLTPELATIHVPNAFYCKWFELHYRDLIGCALEAELDGRPEIRFEIAPPERPRRPESPPPSRPARAPARRADLKLNRNYVFSRFVTGPSNQLAHAAALAVVESPGLAYNPLFLHGGVGLGKTHLMHAVAHALLKKSPQLDVRYLSCESFMNQFIYALQKGGIERFRARYRKVDVLLIDDIHILAKRPRTQEEFFHTFNELYNSHKQVILSGDNAPEDIPSFEERLISRFKWGLEARIDPPCIETRMAIIRKKAELRGKELPDAVVEFIAETARDNIRELEGAVLKTIGYASLMNRPADIRLAREVLRAGTPPRRQGPITCKRIQKAVVGWYGVTASDIQSKSRARSVAFPRQVCMYLARRLTGKSLQEIGRAYGGRDHSTVAHACDRVERAMAAEPEFKATVDSLIEQIQAD
jgi:chromosomal replication initiator protein